MYSPRSVSTGTMPFCLEEIVERDLLADHGLALGHRAGADATADVENQGAGVGGRRGIVHVAAGRRDFRLVGFEIEVEMGERVVLDVARGIAQRVELRQAVGGVAAALDEAGAGIAERALELRVGERLLHVLLEARRGDGVHLVETRAARRLADRRDVAHAGQHLGDVAHAHFSIQPLQLAGHVHEAAEVAGKQRVGAGRGDVVGLLGRRSRRKCPDT